MLLVTGLYAGIAALILIGLSVLVIRQRLRTNTPLLDGNHPALQQAIRAQANFVEYVPLALIMLAALEANGVGRLWLHLLGILLCVARVLHAYGLLTSRGRSFGRAVGMVGTYTVLSVEAVWLILRFLGL